MFSSPISATNKKKSQETLGPSINSLSATLISQITKSISLYKSLHATKDPIQLVTATIFRPFLYAKYLYTNNSISNNIFKLSIIRNKILASQASPPRKIELLDVIFKCLSTCYTQAKTANIAGKIINNNTWSKIVKMLYTEKARAVHATLLQMRIYKDLPTEK